MKPLRITPKLLRELDEVVDQEARKPQTPQKRQQSRIVREALKKIMKRRRR